MPSKKKSPAPKKQKPYAMTLIFQPEHEVLLARLEKRLLDTRASVLRRALVEMAERLNLRDSDH